MIIVLIYDSLAPALLQLPQRFALLHAYLFRGPLQFVPEMISPDKDDGSLCERQQRKDERGGEDGTCL